MLKTKIIQYGEGEGQIAITVSEASAIIGMRRSILQGTAATYLEKASGEESTVSPLPLDKMARLLVVQIQFPDLQAAVVEATGIEIPMTPEEFCNLPCQLVNAWDNAVYDLNPHWMPQPAEEADDGGSDAPSPKKKAAKRAEQPASD